MNTTNRIKLSTMMFLEFFIWGAWLPLIFGYLPSLGFTPGEQAWILNAFPIAAIVGMFFSNQWADRKFVPEKFLAFSHLIGGLAIAGPIIFHLVKRTTRERTLFSSLMFLVPTPPRLSKRSRLEHWLLLLLRRGPGAGSPVRCGPVAARSPPIGRAIGWSTPTSSR